MFADMLPKSSEAKGLRRAAAAAMYGDPQSVQLQAAAQAGARKGRAVAQNLPGSDVQVRHAPAGSVGDKE